MGAENRACRTNCRFWGKMIVMKSYLAPVLVGLLACPVFGDVTMPAIFSDHMVLQQSAKLNIWGWADPGEVVAVSLGDQKGSATADNNGNWAVALNPVGTPGMA